ncbi:hypothetical protein GCM10010274_35970 [Streptomyces lavendofoliae]|uniref:Uncharacterized protein n=1 Tax=Streptomyces lavendofoliae TaxID=67314 RepID=A0A918HZP9_9ACTN|nr:hypothetical protein GCM10010274_35970 [Streptomyces lavendofoliae]
MSFWIRPAREPGKIRKTRPRADGVKLDITGFDRTAGHCPPGRGLRLWRHGRNRQGADTLLPLTGVLRQRAAGPTT